MTTKEKAAYLKGLADGLGMLDDSKSGRVLSCIIDILGELASDLEDIEDSVFSLSEEVEQLGVDLDEVGDILCGDEEDDLRGCCGSSCCCGDEDEDEDEDEEDGEEPVFYEVTCPACGETITVDEDVLALGSIPCPKCGEDLEFDFDYDPDEDEEADGENAD
ncbi:MAG: hypothetical protein MR033_06100 [Clostridiales bacterium]|nr:hypothetical protein [Clostridiales bacterium]